VHLDLYVQSEYPSDYVRARIDSFLEEYLLWLESDLDEQEFDRQREGLISNLREGPKTLEDEFARRWTEIGARRYDFHRREAIVKAMETATLEDLRTFAQEVVRSCPRIYAQVNSISDTPSKQPPDASVVAATPDRLWRSDGEAQTFRQGATWIENDWSSQDTY
jgi:secreted Zn-dependent insulinase-like peptidase